MNEHTLFWLACRNLYGDRFKSAVASRCGVSERTIERWKSGESPVPEHALWKLLDDTARRARILEVIRKNLELKLGIR